MYTPRSLPKLVAGVLILGIGVCAWGWGVGEFAGEEATVAKKLTTLSLDELTEIKVETTTDTTPGFLIANLTLSTWKT